MSSQKSLKKGSPLPPMGDKKLRLYSMRFCPFAKRARLVLTHKQIPFETVNINLADKPEWYPQISPEGKVPLLQHDKKFLNESLIIAEYIDDIYPAKKLQPEDPFLKAKDKVYLTKFDKVTEFVFKIHFSKETDSLIEEVTPTFQYYEDLKATQSKYFGGNSVSFFDYMIWPWFETLLLIRDLHAHLPIEAMVPQAKFPNLRKWMDSMMQVSAVKELYTPEAQAEFFKMLKEGKRDFDAGL